MEENQNKTETKIKIIQRQAEEKESQALASKLGLPYLDLTPVSIDPSVFDAVSLEQAKKTASIILRKFGNSIKIAVKNPANEETKKLIKELKDKGFALEIYVVSQSSLEDAWRRFKHVGEERKKITKEVEIAPEKIGEFQKEISTFKDVRNKLETASRMTTTEIIEIILAGAIQIDASDVHFEVEEKQTRLRCRIDGILQDVTDLPTSIHLSILSRIKIISELKLNVHNIPQDGRFSIVLNNQEIEIRTSIIPAAYGENIVLRILNPNTIGLELKDLGLEEYALEIINRELKKPNGMIVNTGPTGSGKTTTLYAFVKKINNPEIKVITLENPIEYHLEGIEQTQVNPDKGYTFAIGLRAILRQDPDVILLGEIRDNETAETAIHAALTGHLVFTTLHTNDAAGAIPRLVDMRVNPTLIPPALNLVIAQRLVRRVCKNCAGEYKPNGGLLKELNSALKTVPAKIKIKYPKLDKKLTILKAGKGCEKCNFNGYKGRIAVMELFVIDKEMEKVIIKTPSVIDIYETAIKRGMITMKQEGILKVLKKITTLEEIEKVLGV
jgi:type IV pilus assembly protein PilB